MEDKAVGLIAYDLEDYDIWRLMIDSRYQGRGYGRKAMELALDILRKEGRLKTARTSIIVENNVMRNLIVSFGFKENGKVTHYREDGEPNEIEFELNL
ncbi:MAG: GNAT family N-acetyltransferase [Candidatus Heimdallarchaeota archaeon]|nr:GNAT family N-acetyltransferase [Candidatus Heimdallarchaeota archaeon]MBY8992954.1 GNAT family N-acetyltransferase [Candidatus Heimdallarchaeota archaeon]